MKLSLFSDDMIGYMENPIYFTKIKAIYEKPSANIIFNG